METPKRILDLGCGIGGASMGYYNAWKCEIIGVDIKPQPNYPFTFIQDDAINFSLDGYDFIHASMPCTRWAARQMNYDHPDLITPLRERLHHARTNGKLIPWVMENVAQAPLRHDLQLCGTSFGLSNRLYELRRHRYFEIFPEPIYMTSPECEHNILKETVSIWGRSVKYNGYEEIAIELMEMPWAKWKDFKESLPPKYTEFIGHQLLLEP